VDMAAADMAAAEVAMEADRAGTEAEDTAVSRAGVAEDMADTRFISTLDGDKALYSNSRRNILLFYLY